MEDGLISPEPIITNEYALDQINDALQASMNKRDLSGVIVPH
jgi:Zn-dependent alcohol dehydrogenase